MQSVTVKSDGTSEQLDSKGQVKLGEYCWKSYGIMYKHAPEIWRYSSQWEEIQPHPYELSRNNIMKNVSEV